jgi:hypothetical protein
MNHLMANTAFKSSAPQAGAAAGTETFRARLSDPVLAKMLDHWLDMSAAACGATPRRGDLDPAAIPTLLRHLQIHQREADGRFRCRLSGTAIVQQLGRDATGSYLDEAIRPEAVAGRMRVFNRALETGMPVVYSGVIEIPGRGMKAYQRLMLPLADAEGRPVFVLSAMTFKMLGPTDTAKLNDARQVYEMQRDAAAPAAPGFAVAQAA